MPHSPPPTPGPDLLARYLNAYLQACQLSDVERPWGLGDDGLDNLWGRLTEVLASDPKRLNRIISEELAETERVRIIETLAPLIFALPLRSYPAELRAAKSGSRLVLSLHHIPHKEKESSESVGYLPAALTEAFISYLHRVLHWPEEKQRCLVTISSGGRRRRVRITELARKRGITVRFLERIKSPADE